MRSAAASVARRRRERFALSLGLLVSLLAFVIPASAGTTLEVKTLTPLNGKTVSGNVTWQVTVASSSVDHVDFFIDGSYKWREHVSPYLFNGVYGGLNTKSLTNGGHVLTAKAYAKNNAGTGSSSVKITVANTTTAPPPPPSAPTPLPPPPPAQCADRIDNDNDGKIDYPADRGCTSSSDNDEKNPGPAYLDPNDFPKNTEHLSFSSEAQTQHFQVNILRGCNPGLADRTKAANPKSVNLIIVSSSVSPDGVTSGPNCGNEDGFAITYGRGYLNDLNTIVSPYPGIGTIRPYRADDWAHYADGQKFTAFTLNWCNSGSDDATAEWGARLRAHWFLKQLSTGTHPGIDGLYGDNASWWSPYVRTQRSSGGALISCYDDTTPNPWDTAQAANAAKLKSLISPKFVSGANGGGLRCGGFGSNGAAYGGLTGTECSSFDFTTWERSNAVWDPVEWDKRIPQMKAFIDAGVSLGRAHYGALAEYGTCGVGNAGHVLTAADKRLGLALVSMAGWALWAVNDCSWASTAIPGTLSGTNAAIPEMGDTPEYSRGWLGQPTADAVKLANGVWKRTFTGGVIYGNPTASAQNADGHSIPAKDALFLKRT
jgi:hypothetical protein